MSEPRVVHRDEALLVLAKPSGLPTTSPDDGDCLVRRAKALDPDAPNLHPTSRLDAEVSGLVTFARTREANRDVLGARERGAYRRLYVALALASPSESRWTGPIAIDPRDPRKRRVHPDGKPSATRVELLAQSGEVRLLALRPETGRTHQIRVHAAHAGCPILGDRPYGGAKRLTLPNGRVLTARRTMLHCARVELETAHAGTLRFADDPPDDFRALWLGEESVFELDEE